MSRHKSDHYRRVISPAPEAVVENPIAINAIALNSDTSVPIVEEYLSTDQESDNRSMDFKESPIEEKIQQLVDDRPAVPVRGWENDMQVAPIDGSRVMVSESAKDQGVLVYWRISKSVDRKNLRYVSNGRWTDFLSKVDIAFVPKYWKPYDPEEYWPLQGGAS